jgi:cytochrome c553
MAFHGKHASAVALLAAVLVAAGGALLAAGGARAADLQRGAEVYRLCAQCHEPNGVGNPLFLAPTIANLPDWYIRAQLEAFRSGLRGLHPEDTGGLRMYPMSRAIADQADLEAVAAYAASLPDVTPPRRVEGDAARGQALYTPCTACHGPQGAGNQALNAPPIATQSDWYLLTSLEKFKAGIRGNDPKNANAQIMRGMANTLPDEQAMKDVVAYIKSLSGQTAAASGQ